MTLASPNFCSLPGSEALALELRSVPPDSANSVPLRILESGARPEYSELFGEVTWALRGHSYFFEFSLDMAIVGRFEY